jgi:protocatechuate 3,4-dioxygenase beta subunit
MQRALELDQAPRASVSGTVRDDQGRPLQGAKVCAFADGDRTKRVVSTPCNVTAADGRYRIADLGPAIYDVTASAPRFVPGRHAAKGRRDGGVRLLAGKERQGVDITLHGGAVQIFGTVRDIAGGVIPGAEVSPSMRGWSLTVPTVAVADDDGAFSLWVGKGSLWLNARAEGYGDETQGGRAPGSHFNLYLTPESVLVGRVVDIATGDPIEGAKVSAGWRSQTLTDADGRFRIEGLGPGKYKPTAKADEGYGEAEQSVHLGVGETSDPVVVQLHPAVTVSGTVVIRDGDETRPCERGFAALSPIPAAAELSHRGRSDESGEVHLAGVLPGRYEVTASCTGQVSEDAYGEIEVEDEPIEGLVWEVTPGLAIRGRVVVDDPALLHGLTVRARSTGGEARGKRGWGSTDQFGDDGSFEMVGLPPNTYKVVAEGSDYPEPEEPLEVVLEDEDIDGIEIEVEPGAVIRGVVKDEAGAPVTSATVRAEGPGRRWSSEQVADDGTFEIRGLRGGEYRVLANHSWRSTLRKPGSSDDDVQGEVVQVEAGEEAEVTLVVEGQGETISGTVVDASGSPVLDAFVRAERISDSKAANLKNTMQQARWGDWNEQPIMTDSDGTFTIEGLSKGTYTVWASRKGGGEGFVEGVSVGSDGVTVRLQPTGRLEGKVTLASGEAPRRFKVHLHDEATGFSARDSFFATDGRFVLEALPPGSFRLTAECADGSGDTQVTLEEGAAKAGVTVKLEKKVSVKGRVVDLESGEPVPGMMVSMSRKKGGDMNFSFGGGDKRNITDESGTYELDAVPLGPVSVLLFPRGLGDDSDYSFSQQALEVKDGSPYEVPDIQLAKTRVKDDAVAGDLGFKLKEVDPGIDWSDRELIVGFVRPEGPAAKAGLKVGDKIISVDGHDVTGSRAAHYYTLSRVPVGTAVEFGVEGGDAVTITSAKKP